MSSTTDVTGSVVREEPEAESSDNQKAGRRHRLHPRPRADLTPKRFLALPAIVLLTVALLQDPGKTVADTKAAVMLAPAKFLGQILHLWNSQTDLGSVGNQSLGYLVPMGPFFLLTHALGIPPAVAQRLWLALLFIVAFWGLVRLADALGIGNRLGRILGGLGYAVSPFVLSRVGDTSGIVMAGTMLPWVMIPLVRATRPLPLAPAKKLSLRRAAALSGIAVFLTGGINATVTLDVLIAPVIWLVFMCRGRQAWVLRAWWAAAVISAVAWWVGGLALQGRYGIDFIRYTESATTTTSVTSLPEVLRGTSDWFGYLRLGGVASPSAWTYVVAPAAIVASFAVAGLGLAGLCRPGTPVRRFLLPCLAVGMIAIAAAYPGNANGILADQVRQALAGALGPLRNVNKFQPLVRLPLALGLANCLPLVAWGGRRFVGWRSAVNVVGALTVTAAVVIGAAPLGLSRLYQENRFAVPAYWQTAADWLAGSAKDSRTLLLPGTGFANYDWGNSRDQPLLWLSSTPWAGRNLIPLGGVNSTRWLDAIDQQLDRRSAPKLGATLVRGGIGYVIVTNDLNNNSTDPPASSDQIHAALAASGLKRVASFGPMVAARPSAIQLFFHVTKVPGRYPALEIYRVPGAARVDAYPTSELAVLSGGPEALTTLGASKLLGNRPTVLAADLADPSKSANGYANLPAGVQPSTWIDTDTLTRRDESFGLVHNGASYVLSATGDAAGSTTSAQTRFDVDPKGHQTIASYSGVKDVEASASGFSLRQTAQLGPPAAVDGDPDTAWQANGYPNRNVGQWLQLDLEKSSSVPYVTVRLLAESGKRSRIRAFRVTTSTGSRVVTLPDTEAPQKVALPPGDTTFIRLTIQSVSNGSSNLLGPGIREVAIPGVTIARQLVAPADVSKVFPSSGPQVLDYFFARDRGDPFAFVVLDTELQLDRSFSVPRDAQLHASATAVLLNRARLPRADRAGNVTLACGAGPNVTIDGHRYRTYVSGSAAAMRSGQPVLLELCSKSPVKLAAGQHLIRTSPGTNSAVYVDTFTLSDQKSSADAASRGVTPTVWGDEHRQIQVDAGEASVLTIHENFNKSWSATAAGKKLTPIRVDGWQQGFLLPASGAVTVNLVNHPGEALRQNLVLTAVLVLLLFLAAAIPSRRSSRIVLAPRPHRMAVIRAATLAAAAGTTILVAGPFVALVVPVLALVVWPLRRAVNLLVVAGVSVATGMALAATSRYSGSHQGSFSTVAQVAVALALAVALLTPGMRRPVEAGSTEPDAGDQPDEVPLEDVPLEDVPLDEVVVPEAEAEPVPSGG